VHIICQHFINSSCIATYVRYINTSMSERYYHHRKLHSFPTRRSSDLYRQNDSNPGHYVVAGREDLLRCRYKYRASVPPSLAPAVVLFLRSPRYQYGSDGRGRYVGSCRRVFSSRDCSDNKRLRSLRWKMSAPDWQRFREIAVVAESCTTARRCLRSGFLRRPEQLPDEESGCEEIRPCRQTASEYRGSRRCP